ncbi:hypothetical protein A2U01_0104983, partial [Trifolium medium]|nr:hypothetical protein [Trifolium medium]
CAARRVAGATRSLARFRVVLLLVATRRAGVFCAARGAALFRAFGFWFMRYVQCSVARRAGLVRRVDFC